MDNIHQEQQAPPSEPKKNELLEEFEFGVGGIAWSSPNTSASSRTARYKVRPR